MEVLGNGVQLQHVRAEGSSASESCRRLAVGQHDSIEVRYGEIERRKAGILAASLLSML